MAVVLCFVVYRVFVKDDIRMVKAITLDGYVGLKGQVASIGAP